jgi:hypothetical protein
VAAAYRAATSKNRATSFAAQLAAHLAAQRLLTKRKEVTLRERFTKIKPPAAVFATSAEPFEKMRNGGTTLRRKI